MFAEARIERFTRQLRAAGLPLRLRLWNGRAIDIGRDPRVTLVLREPASVDFLFRATLSRLGEAYVDGLLDIEGPLRDAIALGEALVRRVSTRLPKWQKWRRTGRHTRARDARAIEYHYDVSDDFYGLWLDRHLAYSCAYFATGDEPLDAAQEAKFDHVCRKLMLGPGQRLLDIGCGWGGLVRWAARHYGVDATGITLSRNQYAAARARIEADGLGDRCRVLLQDYRDVAEDRPFDRISSIGMFEHVGLENLAAYFRKIERLLAPDGVALNHGITTTDPDSGWVGLGAGEFVHRYVFPHGELPHLALAIDRMSRGGLEVIDVESLRFHYARTLALWSERLESAQEDAVRLVGGKRYRIWRLYLAGCAHAFEQGWVSIHQLLAVKQDRRGMAPARWTRDYLYRA